MGAQPVTLAEDSLTYQETSLRPGAKHSSELLTVRLRYKDPKGSTSRLLETPVGRPDRRRDGGHAVRLGGGGVRHAAARLGAQGAGELGAGAELARGARGADEQGYRGEFIGLVETARTLAGATPVAGRVVE